MENKNYKLYVFADAEHCDEYGLPKLHTRTHDEHVATLDWIMLASKLRTHYDGYELVDYKIPEELKKLNTIRELSRGEIGILEAAILGCPKKN